VLVWVLATSDPRAEKTEAAEDSVCRPNIGFPFCAGRNIRPETLLELRKVIYEAAHCQARNLY
jgi:hypothetical protein